MHLPLAWKVFLNERDASRRADFIFVAAGRPSDAERSDNFVSDLNRNRARKECNVWQRAERSADRIFSGERCKRARCLELKDRPESHDYVCFAERRRRRANS
jgi:hypothetical protein